MDLAIPGTSRCTSSCPNSHSQLHLGVNDLDHDNHHERHGISDDQEVRRGLHVHQRQQRHPLRWHWSFGHNLFRTHSGRRIPARNSNPQRWFNRRNDDRPDHRYRLCYQLLVGLLPIIFCLGAKAETTAIANPVATSSGSVNNQAVQINQGGYSTQSFGPGHQCNSSTLVFTPFYLGNDVNQQRSYVRNANFGAQLTLSVPLDGGMVELCKALGKAKVRREQLNYEIARALRCAELKNAGFTFHPDSQFHFLCADIVPVNARVPKTAQVSPASSEASLPEP